MPEKRQEDEPVRVRDRTAEGEAETRREPGIERGDTNSEPPRKRGSYWYKRSPGIPMGGNTEKLAATDAHFSLKVHRISG